MSLQNTSLLVFRMYAMKCFVFVFFYNFHQLHVKERDGGRRGQSSFLAILGTGGDGGLGHVLCCGGGGGGADEGRGLL